MHGCWLESYWGIPGQIFGWKTTDSSPRMASKVITAMDRRTWQALTTGYVELPRRRVHTGVWFRLLRTLLDELNTPLSQCGVYAKSIRFVWKQCGHQVRAGQYNWRPYETLDLGVQLQMLEAAATAIDLIESMVLSPHGEQAELFLPEPQTKFTKGLPSNEGEREPMNHLQKALNALNEVMAEARSNPETARSLFKLASYKKRDPGFQERLRTIFANEGIPLEFLSHYSPE